MLTRLEVRNFKCFEELDIDLGSPIVFVGPNNAGKTAAMQALSLWHAGLRRWYEKKAHLGPASRRTGVALHRRDLFALAHPTTAHLWMNKRVRRGRRRLGKTITSNVRIEILVHGVDDRREWSCGLEFDYASEDQIHCRPLRVTDMFDPQRMPVPSAAVESNIVYLPPLSGLVETETELSTGAMNVRIGQGRTAEVLRNLCYTVYQQNAEAWKTLAGTIEQLFGARLGEPKLHADRGEITLDYREDGASLDISAAGRGLHQTLLLLSFMHANPGAVLLLDEPDAHLEILRQRQTYDNLVRAAREANGQIILASHSEVLLNEAVGRDLVISFVGTPRRLDSNGSQIRKALAEIGYEQFFLAEQRGWVLYLEGPTDLAILRSLARRLALDEAIRALDSPFVRYVGNKPSGAERHFFGLRQAVPDLMGIALYDHLPKGCPQNPQLHHMMWARREIENYICTPAVLEAFAESEARSRSAGPVFDEAERQVNVAAIQSAIDGGSKAMETLGKESPWGNSCKVSDDFLPAVFKEYYARLALPNLMDRKSSFYELAHCVAADAIDTEVQEKLQAIARVAASAMPRS